MPGFVAPAASGNGDPDGAFNPCRVARVVVGEGPLSEVDGYFRGFPRVEPDLGETLEFLRGAG